MLALFRKLMPDIQKWAYNYAGFNQYGLYRDDLISDTPDVLEALRRLPPEVVEARTFRLIRAMQLDCQKKVLPKEQWTQLESDKHYLLPVLEEVIQERKEREAWNAQ